jgi:D-sedoheptulose 7-phosphate isomerase
MNIEKFSIEYVKNLTSILEKINTKNIQNMILLLEESIKNKSKIYVLGNGGSSATASHMVGDLGAGLRRRDIINFDIINLSDNVATTSAIANDIGFENIFYMQLKGILRKNDIVIALSCSGNSPNIIKAINYAKEVGSKVIGFTGFDGGELKKKCDISFHVQTPKNEYGLVEDVHMVLDHIIYFYYIKKGKLDT